MPQQPTLLILDDDPLIVRLLHDCVSRLGHRVLTSQDMPAARAVLTDSDVDVVIADLRMNGRDTLELLDWPEYRRNETDCIYVTGYATTEIAVQAFKRGVFGLIRKPFEVSEVLETVRRCLSRRGQLRDNEVLVGRLTAAKQELEQVVEDRTDELRRAYEQVVKASQQVERLEQLKSQFINIVSHEFNTPLNVIKGYVGLLLSSVFGPLRPEQVEAVRTMEREVDRIVELLGDFVRIQSLEDEHFSFAKEPLDVAPLAHEVVGTITPFVRQRAQQFILNVPDSLPRIVGNARQLSIVIKNLLVNAIRYTRDGGLITFSAQPYALEKRAGVLFLVRDTGVGIPASEYQRVFSKFYEIKDINLHSTGRVEFGSSGLGLGLSIARRIVDNHGGRIWVESEVDSGSRFYFFIPAVAVGDDNAMQAAMLVDEATKDLGTISELRAESEAERQLLEEARLERDRQRALSLDAVPVDDDTDPALPRNPFDRPSTTKILDDPSGLGTPATDRHRQNRPDRE